MRRLLLGQLRHRRGRLAALGLAILVAAASFTLLTASASTSSLHVRQTLQRNFRGAYDILVRPKESFTQLERRKGLIRDNYLSGIYGGITLRQYHEIARIPGVEVAAPIANLGTTLVSGVVTVPLRHVLDGARDQLFRIRFSWGSQRGLSRYPGADEYLYATRRHFTPGAGQTSVVADPATGRDDQVCDGYNDTEPIAYRPFVPGNSSRLLCAGSNTAALRQANVFKPEAFGQASVYFEFMLPVNVAAIDPTAEQRLLGLSRAVVSGRYLRTGDRPYVSRDRYGGEWLRIPAIAASRSFVDETLQAQIERLVVPETADLPGILGAGACGANGDPAQQHCGFILGSTTSTPIQPGPPGHRHATAYHLLTGLRGVRVAKQTFSAQQIYASAVRRNVWVVAYWRSANVRYRQLDARTLEPLPASNPQQTWTNNFTTSSGYFDQPTDNLDRQFRRLSETPARVGGLGNGGPNSEPRTPTLKPVGRFDPARLRGFSALSQVPLETYYPPSLVPADARTAGLLHDKPLLPSQNLGDYEQQPPLLLTNLAGLRPLLSPSRFLGLSPRQQHKPISVIRIRVRGVNGPNALSETRIRTVAQLIHQRTGLDVDITAGSSPTPITIKLPAGRFGRPALALREGWVQKGASVSYLRALDRKDLALFALILVVCALFLGNGAFASVRARRSELGALATLGWSPAETFRVVLGELALVGLAAGIAGTGLAAGLVSGFGLHFPLLRTLLVLPIAVALALAAGVLPAWLAAHGSPLDAVRPQVVGGGRGRRVRSIAAMAFTDLARLPVRSVIGATGLALGVAALTVLVAIERSFSGVLVSTALGNAVSIQIRGADFVALGLTVALAALSAADVLYLNVSERRAELVTLATLGWSEGETRRLLILEALYLALAAGFAGALLGVLVGSLVLGVSAGPVAVAAAIAAVGAIGIGLVASLLPLVRLRALAAPEVLAAE